MKRINKTKVLITIIVLVIIGIIIGVVIYDYGKQEDTSAQEEGQNILTENVENSNEDI